MKGTGDRIEQEKCEFDLIFCFTFLEVLPFGLHTLRNELAYIPTTTILDEPNASN